MTTHVKKNLKSQHLRVDVLLGGEMPFPYQIAGPLDTHVKHGIKRGKCVVMQLKNKKRKRQILSNTKIMMFC